MTVLNSLSKQLDLPIADCPVIDDAQQVELQALTQFEEQTCQRSIVDVFVQQAEKFADRPAIVFGETELTYAQLNARANQVANRIVASGKKPGALIGVHLDRSIELLVAILGVLKAGCAYVPLDPLYPQERKDYIVQDSQLDLLLVSSEQQLCLSSSPELVDIKVLLADAQPLCDTPNVQLEDEHPAYVIYTSGSTGNPKGVLQTHKNVLSLFASTSDLFEFNEADVWTLFHSVSFDFSVWEIWGALLFGAKLVIPCADTVKDTPAFVALCRKHKVSILNQTPGAFGNFSETVVAQSEPLCALRYVVFGGEALHVERLLPGGNISVRMQRSL